MKKILLTTTAIGVLAVPAMAADLAPASPLIMGPTWSGFYLGGTLGGAWDNNSVNVVTTNTFVNNAVLTPLGRTAGPASAVASTANIGTGSNSIIGGFEAGYNWQVGPSWLLGIETDIEFLTTPGGSQVTQVAPRIGFPRDTFTSTLSVTENVNWLGTVRGRLGFLVTPTWLVYGTGGLAYGGASSSTAIAGGETPNTGTSNIAGAGSFSSTRVGWAAGAGLEWLFAPHWTVKAEWLHYDLGSVSYSNGTMTGFVLGHTIAFTDVSSSTVKFTGDIVRAGLNYKF